LSDSSYKPSEKHLIESGQGPFTNDPWFGRQLLAGQDFINADDFLSLDDAAAQIKSAGKRVLLNIGDSSTAGWDTRVTVVNKQRKDEDKPLILAFFQYPTYSDVLRDKTNDLIVLNAGIPGHTTLQGLRRNRYLLQELKNRGVTVDFVSFYFGNNDCQWESNTEDKNTLRSELPLFLDKRRIQKVKPDPARIHLRTHLSDFENNIRTMIRDARRFGAQPMLIMPETPIYWQPGYRFVADNFEIKQGAPGADMVGRALNKAMELWQNNKDAEWSNEKQRALEEAREIDFVIPRIKKTYRSTLESIAHNTDIPLVRTSIPREEDDIKYFVDYCHPIGDANVFIADKITDAIKACDDGRYANQASGSILVRLLDSPLFTFIGRLNSRSKKNSAQNDEHEDIYTLF